MSTNLYRTRTAYITQAHHEALSALAAVENDDCADASLERLLGPILAQQAELGWLIERRRSDREAMREEYHARLRGRGQA